MIELTDAMVAAYEQARRAYWTALGHEAPEGGPTVAEHGREASRAGLKAVFELVERDYEVKLRGEDCLCGADLGPPWDTVPHRRAARGCRRGDARPEMLSDRLGYPTEVGDEDWKRIKDREVPS